MPRGRFVQPRQGWDRGGTILGPPVPKQICLSPKLIFLEMVHTNFSPLFEKHHISPSIQLEKNQKHVLNISKCSTVV